MSKTMLLISMKDFFFSISIQEWESVKAQPTTAAKNVLDRGQIA